jgi:hypothetical protein
MKKTYIVGDITMKAASTALDFFAKTETGQSTARKEAGL